MLSIPPGAPGGKRLVLPHLVAIGELLPHLRNDGEVLDGHPHSFQANGEILPETVKDDGLDARPTLARDEHGNVIDSIAGGVPQVVPVDGILQILLNLKDLVPEILLLRNGPADQPGPDGQVEKERDVTTARNALVDPTDGVVVEVTHDSYPFAAVTPLTGHAPSLGAYALLIGAGAAECHTQHLTTPLQRVWEPPPDITAPFFVLSWTF